MEGDVANNLKQAATTISIHALRVEGDWLLGSPMTYQKLISIHALRVEGDTGTYSYTLAPTDFYPRPPGGGRPLLLICAATRSHISIHALRVEGD